MTGTPQPRPKFHGNYYVAYFPSSVGRPYQVHQYLRSGRIRTDPDSLVGTFQTREAATYVAQVFAGTRSYSPAGAVLRGEYPASQQIS